jgi:hypothetical protein
MSAVSGAERGVSSPVNVQAPLLEFGGDELLGGLRSALLWLQANQEQTNALNVFPVPDGDTGSNMYLTLQSAVEEAERVTESASAASVMGAAAHGSLLGARGNSGVILSQVLRGFAQALGERRRVDASLVVGAFGAASQMADSAVVNPAEGTILTVVRDCAAAVAGAAETSLDLRVLLRRSVCEAHAAVARTTDQLPVLKEAGVVDAGGFGFAALLEGFARAIADLGVHERFVAPREGRLGHPSTRFPTAGQAPSIPAARRWGAAAVAERAEGWGFCTEFLVEGPGIDLAALRARLAPQGDSLLAVGDADRARVHIHTLAPAEVVSIASRYGRLAQLKVEDMAAQHHAVIERAAASDREAATPRRRVAVVPVASGGGFQDILRSLGADPAVDGGQTMNPSTQELLTAVLGANADIVILLPNNDNIILTAQQVDALADGVDVRVVATRNVLQAIGALLSWEPDAPVDEVVRRMYSAAQQVRSLEITRAVRHSRVNGHDIQTGDVLACVDGQITHVGSDDCTVLEDVLRGLAEPPELATVYRGAGITEQAAKRLLATLAEAHPAIVFELHDGGQDHCPYVLSLE